MITRGRYCTAFLVKLFIATIRDYLFHSLMRIDISSFNSLVSASFYSKRLERRLFRNSKFETVELAVRKFWRRQDVIIAITAYFP